MNLLGRNFAALPRRIALGLLFVVGILSIIATRDPNGPPDPSTGPFSLAYIDTGFQLRMRWSTDGITWTTPFGATPSADRAPGIGIDESGLLYLAVFDDGASRASMMMGLGPDTWDSTSRTVGNGHPSELNSGTSITHVTGQGWLVAYRNQNRAKIVKFDSSPNAQDFGAEVTPVPSVVNANLIDKPAIVNLNGRVLTSWLMNNQLQMTTGDIVAGDPVWQPGYLFSSNVTETGFGLPVGAHDLAHDGLQFYAAVVRKRDPLPGEQIERHFLFIYTSANGLNWTRLTSPHEVVISPESLSVAARSQNDILVMLSRAATNLPPARVFHFDGSAWSIRDDAAVFGGNPMNKGHDFTLVSRN